MQKRMLSILLVVLLALCIVPAFADTALQGGLEVTTTMDKSDYTVDEPISMRLAVTNTNDYEITDVCLSVEVPAGYAARNGLDSKSLTKIVAGGTASLEVTFDPFGLPNTGDPATPALWGLMLLASFGGLLWFAVNYRQTAKRLMALILAVALASAACGFDFFAVARAEDDSIRLVTTVTVDGAELELVAHVEFGYRGMVSTLAVDEDNHLAGQENTVIFTAESPNNATIHLFESGKEESLGVMHDDGRNGDEIPMDGVYSLKLNVTAEKAMIREYHAKAGTELTNSVELYFYDRPTEDAIIELQGIETRIDQIEEAYLDADGFVPEAKREAALKAVKAYAESLLAEGLLLEYSYSEASVAFNTRYGLMIVYTPKIEGVKSNGTQMNIYTFQPYWSDWGDNYYEVVAQALASSYEDYDVTDYRYSNVNNYDDNVATRERITNLGPNSVVLWDAHGVFVNKKIGPAIATGEALDWNAYLDYAAEFWEKIYVLADGRFYITGKFVNEYCGDMSNSLIYLGTCYSAHKHDYDKKNHISNAFINKGAIAVIGNTHEIQVWYDQSMMYTIFARMCTLNPNNQKFYTLSSALNYARSQYGDDDNDKTPARVIIVGGDDADDFRLYDARGALSGKVVSASDRSTPIANAQIKVMNEVFGISIPHASTVTGVNGRYAFERLNTGMLRITVSAPGYIPFEGYADIRFNETTYLQTYLMIAGVEGQQGIASGSVSDAITGSALRNVTIEIRNGWDNQSAGRVLQTIHTDNNGEYSVRLPIGNYTLNATADGYASTSHNIIVQPDMNTTDQNFSMTPTTTTGDQYRIKLTWGEDPRDLDSHMYGTLSNGETFHTYYADQDAYDGNVHVCNLDRDDTTSYGPEHVTLTATGSQPYYYFIHRYDGSGSIATSDARIEVYKGNTLIRTFNAPTNLGSGDYWNVFAIVNGEIVVRNTITSSAEVSYASAGPLSVRTRSIDFELPAK